MVHHHWGWILSIVLSLKIRGCIPVKDDCCYSKNKYYPFCQSIFLSYSSLSCLSCIFFSTCSLSQISEFPLSHLYFRNFFFRKSVKKFSFLREHSWKVRNARFLRFNRISNQNWYFSSTQRAIYLSRAKGKGLYINQLYDNFVFSLYLVKFIENPTLTSNRDYLS